MDDDDLEYAAPLGWNNQLLVFDPLTRTWTNPETTVRAFFRSQRAGIGMDMMRLEGDVPSPRAAMGVDLARPGIVVLFGGRHQGSRLGDLYSLDLDTLTWTRHQRAPGQPWPVGRSWATLTQVPNIPHLCIGLGCVELGWRWRRTGWCSTAA